MAVEQFTLQIDKFVEKAKGRLREFTVEFIQDLNEEIIRATPVKFGFLRGSWHASIGSPETGPATLDPSGAGAVAQMNLVAANMQVGQVFFAMNGAAYAGYVEYGTRNEDGTTKMAPRAFVRGTLVRAQAIAEAAAERVGAR